MGDIPDLVSGIRRKSDFDNRGRARFRDVEAIGIIAIEKHHAFGGDDVQQAAEAGFYFIEVAVDVSVVELDVVHDHKLGQVVNKLRALVEKCRVVFVALDDEMLRLPQA